MMILTVSFRLMVLLAEIWRMKSSSKFNWKVSFSIVMCSLKGLGCAKESKICFSIFCSSGMFWDGIWGVRECCCISVVCACVDEERSPIWSLLPIDKGTNSRENLWEYLLDCEEKMNSSENWYKLLFSSMKLIKIFIGRGVDDGFKFEIWTVPLGNMWHWNLSCWMNNSPRIGIIEESLRRIGFSNFWVDGTKWNSFERDSEGGCEGDLWVWGGCWGTEGMESIIWRFGSCECDSTEVDAGGGYWKVEDWSWAEEKRRPIWSLLPIDKGTNSQRNCENKL